LALQCGSHGNGLHVEVLRSSRWWNIERDARQLVDCSRN
jgi:hypothetical protein